ncbi:chromosome partitioning protein ParA [Vibrio aestuarianus]|uniref:chromosome partitioning protein ParA n=1 Tax=Vibrio aestuarianus TaxID=28171 RepID=UPI00237CA1D2|nr:chromosome partitioning protein ParA [Vibrio aestuarianus]MDE1315677.1 chromosome partitioning protein ParA [Vibrio aestuarianus]
MKLNQSFLQELKGVLEESAFSSDDFSFDSTSVEELVVIKFIHHESFQIRVHEVEFEKEVKVSKPIDVAPFMPEWIRAKGDETQYKTEKIKTVQVTMTPGELKATDIAQKDDLSGLSYDLKQWCRYIEKELMVIYAEDASCDEQLSNQIDEMFPEEMFDSTERFSNSEIENLKKGLAGLRDRIHKIREECDISEEQIKSLEVALKKAESSARLYPKGAWLRFNKAKVTNALKKIFSAPEVRQLGYEVIKKIVLKEI